MEMLKPPLKMHQIVETINQGYVTRCTFTYEMD